MKYLPLILGLSLIVLLGPATASRAEEPVKIAVSIPGADHGWTGGVVWWAKKTLDELEVQYPEVEFLMLLADTPAKQISDLDGLMSRGIQGLVVLPHSPALLLPSLEKMREAGIYIVLVDRNQPGLPRDVYVTGDHLTFGRLCGRLAARELDGRGDLAILDGPPGEANDERLGGFAEALAAHPNMRIVDRRPADGNPEKGREEMKNLLARHSRLDALWCQDDDVLESVLAVYEASGRNDLQLILGGGGSQAVIKMIQAEHPLVRATVTNSPAIIHEAVRLTVEHLVRGREVSPLILFPSEVITRANAAEHYHPESGGY